MSPSTLGLEKRLTTMGQYVSSWNFTNKWIFKAFYVDWFIDYDKCIGASCLYFPCCMSCLLFTTRWSSRVITLKWRSGSQSGCLHGAVAPCQRCPEMCSSHANYIFALHFQIHFEYKQWPQSETLKNMLYGHSLYWWHDSSTFELNSKTTFNLLFPVFVLSWADQPLALCSYLLYINLLMNSQQDNKLTQFSNVKLFL